MDDSKISVILTSYNKPNTVGKAIESVLSQTYGNWELFIMDDNSNQETVQVIKKYLTDKRIYYFNSFIENGERYKTTRYATLINEAIPKTNGKFITYLTDDNLFLRDRFKIMIDFYKKNPTVDIVYSEQLIKWFDEYGGFKREMVRRTRGILADAFQKVDHCSVMHTRNIAERVYEEFGSYWDGDPGNWFNGDAAFWNRLTKFARFFPIPNTLDISLKYSDSFQSLSVYLPTKIPDGTLLKGPTTDVYALDNQKRRKISADVFSLLKYNKSQIVDVPDPIVYKYEEGEQVDRSVFLNLTLMPNQRLLKLKDQSEIYWLQNQEKHQVKNDHVFRNYNFDKNQVISFEQYQLDQLQDGLPIENLSIKPSFLPDRQLFMVDSNLYISIDQHLHPIENLVAMKLKLQVNDPIVIHQTVLTQYKQGEPLIWRTDFTGINYEKGM